MKIENFIIVVFSIIFCTLCFIWGVIWMQMALDLSNKVEILEKNYIEYYRGDK